MNKIPTVDTLITWRSQIIEDLETMKVELSLLQVKIKESNERVELIDKLLTIENREEKESNKIPENIIGLIGECEIILREAGKPMHINELHMDLIKKGIPIPGKGNQANVIARIQRSDGRIIRTGHGVYGLPEFGLPERKPVRKRIKRKK